MKTRFRKSKLVLVAAPIALLLLTICFRDPVLRVAHYTLFRLSDSWFLQALETENRSSPQYRALESFARSEYGQRLSARTTLDLVDAALPDPDSLTGFRGFSITLLDEYFRLVGHDGQLAPDGLSQTYLQVEGHLAGQDTVVGKGAFITRRTQLQLKTLFSLLPTRTSFRSDRQPEYDLFFTSYAQSLTKYGGLSLKGPPASEMPSLIAEISDYRTHLSPGAF